MRNRPGLKAMNRACVAAFLACFVWIAGEPNPILAQEPAPQVVAISAHLEPTQDDQPPQVVVTAVIKPGWHIYSLTQKGIPPTKITFEALEGVELGGPLKATPGPLVEKDETLNMILETHSETVRFRAPLKLTSVALRGLVWNGAIRFQACNKETCLFPQTVKFTARPKAE